VTNALSIRGLTKRYDAKRGDRPWPLRRGKAVADSGGFLAVQDFDLEIEAGSFFGLLGPNGAGKTTIISAVCNLIRVTTGEIEIFGARHDTLDARRMVGLAEQDVNLDRFLDVEETLLYHGGYFGMTRPEARRRATEMMDVFDLRGRSCTSRAWSSSTSRPPEWTSSCAWSCGATSIACTTRAPRSC
jgi:ABC-2 type transport system ATP-binding protein